MKQFSKNSSHPTFLAFQELGKVIKTMFLCDYLASEQLRKEIHSGLNTVESWHSASDFIFYGQGGEIRRNELEEQAVAMLSLQLIQNCIVYINTLIIQQLLSEDEWINRLDEEDYRAASLIKDLYSEYSKMPVSLGDAGSTPNRKIRSGNTILSLAQGVNKRRTIILIL